MNILVTGGAGYIGSVVVEKLRGGQGELVVLDNLSTGHNLAVNPKQYPSLKMYVGDVSDEVLIGAICEKHKIDICLHLAALSNARESVTLPYEYMQNNLVSTTRLVSALIDNGVDKMVFASSASAENTTHPYGWTKKACEDYLKMEWQARGFKSICLRFFNAAGATLQHGEDHTPETHLIPRLLRVAAGEERMIEIYGDGSARRDYVHVDDIAEAHIRALVTLQGRGSFSYDVGTGQSHSVLDVIKVVQYVTGEKIPAVFGVAIKHEPEKLQANLAQTQDVLNWKAYYNLEQIVSSAWKWKQKFPKGYEQ